MLSNDSNTTEFTTRIRFTMKEVLPAHDPLAQWIVNIARASNDLMIANGRLLAGFAVNSPAEEHFYDIRAIATHIWELAKFLEESKRDFDEISRFMETLGEAPSADYSKTVELLSEDRESDSPGTRNFKQTLASARDQSTHYSNVNHKLLRSAIERVGDQEGELLVGAKFKDFRATFAANVDVQVFHPLDANDEPFRDFSENLQRVVNQLLRFTRNAIDRYLLEREDLLIVESISKH